MIAQLDPAFVKTRPAKCWSRLVAYSLFEGRPLTTKGQWINPVVLAAHRLWATLPVRPPKRDPIFILGLGRSGTTILGKILGLHAELGFLNEPKALWHAALGDDDLIGSYGKAHARYRMHAGDATEQKARALARSYRVFSWVSGSRRVVDKYPELIFRVPFLDQTFANAHKLVIIRNCHDTVGSIENWSAKNGRAGGMGREDWWGLNGRKWHYLRDQILARDPYFAPVQPLLADIDRHEDMAALEWVATMQEALRLRAQNQNALYFLKYEDLVADPDQTLSAALHFCDLPIDYKMLRYARGILKPAPARPAPQLHPAISALVDETMAALGY